MRSACSPRITIQSTAVNRSQDYIDSAMSTQDHIVLEKMLVSLADSIMLQVTIKQHDYGLAGLPRCHPRLSVYDVP